MDKAKFFNYMYRLLVGWTLLTAWVVMGSLAFGHTTAYPHLGHPTAATVPDYTLWSIALLFLGVVLVHRLLGWAMQPRVERWNGGRRH